MSTVPEQDPSGVDDDRRLVAEPLDAETVGFDRRVLDALEAPIAVLDRGGTIRVVNRAWLDAGERGGAAREAIGPGASYLEACDRARGPCAKEAALVGDGIRAVLRGHAPRFAAECPSLDGTDERWCIVRVTPLPGPAGGAVVTHLDVPEHLLERRAGAPEHDRSEPTPTQGGGRLLLDAAGRILRDPGPDAAGPTGTSLGELVPATAVTLFDAVHPVDLERARVAFLDVSAAAGATGEVRVRVGHRSTRWRQLELVLANQLRVPGVDAVTVDWTDVTDERRSVLTSQFGAELLARLPAAVTVMDDAQVVTYWNDRAAEIYQCTAEEVVDRELRDLGFRTDDPGREAAILTALAEGQRWDGDLDVHLPDGSSVPAYVSIVPVWLPGLRFAGSIVTSVDVSEHRALEYRLEHLALHDHLTGLPNRLLLLDRLNTALSRARRDRTTLAILFVDLDGFKAVNDRLGHAAGDEVLRAVARLLEAVVRDGDTVARIAGDEFVVCAENVDAPQDAIELAERVVAAISASFGTSEQHVNLSASIGIALSRPGTDADMFLRDADTAMYRAKRNGKGRVELFDEALRQQVQVRRTLEEALQHAVRHDQLVLQYQPVVELATGAVVGAEALLRWDHPTLGLVGPERFVTAADEAGLARAVGARAVGGACAAASRWRALRPERPPTVSVDLSPHLFADRALAAQLAGALGRHGLDASLLTVEVAEPVVMADVEAALEATRQLAQLGVRIAVDDVGSGYSSMTYLKRLPVDVLKLDGALVRGLRSSGEDRVIVSAVVDLAAVRGVDVVAEGVESAEQVELLTDLGCRYAQGDLLGPPTDEDELVRRLRHGPSPQEA